MFDVGARLCIHHHDEGYDEEMTVYKKGELLSNGIQIYVVLEGEGGDRYTVDIYPGGVVRFETGLMLRYLNS